MPFRITQGTMPSSARLCLLQTFGVVMFSRAGLTYTSLESVLLSSSHCILRIAKVYTLMDTECTVYAVLYAEYTVLYSVCSVHGTLDTMDCKLYKLSCTLYTLYCTLYYTLHYPPYFRPYSVYSIRYDSGFHA